MMQFGKCLVSVGSNSVQLGEVIRQMLQACFKTLKCDLAAISSSHVSVLTGHLYAQVRPTLLSGKVACPRADGGEIKEACGREATPRRGKWRLA
ncbi:hypothetical protein LZ640_16300 [Aeromonas media]|uniref:hypothetical protein n=1 Tax=Aeromonas media TaxID=651 RepID=UPI001F30E027|nr:hypothetical protein [Aeromonas media]MCE9925990.1 hypothetical protein [Aeromonas media]